MATSLKTQQIGISSLVTTRLAYGCMRIAGTWNPAEIDQAKEAAAIESVLAAIEAGYTLFDHADIYCRGECERLYGKALAQKPEAKRDLVVATKCGIRFPGDPNPDSPHRYDFSYRHILESCDRSLERLQMDTIDIYQLHRPDMLMDPLEVAEAFCALHAAKKVRWFGVSNFLPSMVSALQAHLPFPLVVNQVEIHLGRLACLVDGTLDQCLERRITPLSWSPLGGGWLGAGDAPEGREELVKLMDTMAAKHGTTRANIALAWLLKHPSGIVPIVGSTQPDRIQDATKADRIDLGREDWYRLTVAARGKPLP